ncbi:MAG TPA: hypothetical protein VGM84_21690 [Steroidobacteraceae bacterium]
MTVKTRVLLATAFLAIVASSGACAQCAAPGGVIVSITSSVGARALNADDTVKVDLTFDGRRRIADLQFTIGGRQIDIKPNAQHGIARHILLQTQYGPTGDVSLESDSGGTLTMMEALDSLTVSAVATDDSGACGIGIAQFSTATPRDFVIAVGVAGIRKDPTQANSEVESLTYSRSDAVEVSNHLVRHSGVPADHAYLLLDNTSLPEVPEAKHVLPVNAPSDISKIFARIGRIADRSAHVYFYFSGHSLVDPSAQGDSVFFLLPSSDLGPGGESSRYTWTNLVNDFSRLRARAVLILDTCYSGLGGGVAHDDSSETTASPPPEGPATPAIPAIPARQPPNSAKKVLGLAYQGDEPKREKLPSNVIGVVTSSSGTSPSWEIGDPIHHGLFTYYLLQVGQEVVDSTSTPKALTLDDAFGQKNGTNMARERTTAYFNSSSTPKQKPWADIQSDGVNDIWWVKQ